MREINIRAWDKIDNRMAPVEELHRGWVAIPVYDEDGGHLEKRKLDDVVLMLDTGLKDKNGKEIYEGDVVEFYYLGTHRDVVRYIVDGFKVNTTGHTDDVKIELCLGFPFREMEIIGNVWENPNLIK